MKCCGELEDSIDKINNQGGTLAPDPGFFRSATTVEEDDELLKQVNEQVLIWPLPKGIRRTEIYWICWFLNWIWLRNNKRFLTSDKK